MQTKADLMLTAGIAEFAARAYADASTDRITADCGISKGLLYHYFGTKKGFYLACVARALDALTKEVEAPPEGDFYGALFASMESKIKLCLEHQSETILLNMASRELSQEVRQEKDELLGRYLTEIRARSERVIKAAVAALPLRDMDQETAARGLTLYIRALINDYLTRYQSAPELFFARREEIKSELKAYIDLMLYGVCKERKQ